MLEYEDAKSYQSPDPGGGPPRPYEVRHKEYVRRRSIVENARHSRLLAGTLIASGIAPYGKFREIIDPSLWESLWFDDEFGEIVGAGRTYSHPEIFERSVIPLNLSSVPDWLARSFMHSADYRHLTWRGQEFTAGAMQSRIIRALHDASKAEMPWVSGKVLMQQAGSISNNLLQLFKVKHWDELIESDGRGNYRLNVF
jgi:hypothetical protein